MRDETAESSTHRKHGRIECGRSLRLAGSRCFLYRTRQSVSGEEIDDLLSNLIAVVGVLVAITTALRAMVVLALGWG
jgi:hypothetical protein